MKQIYKEVGVDGFTECRRILSNIRYNHFTEVWKLKEQIRELEDDIDTIDHALLQLNQFSQDNLDILLDEALKNNTIKPIEDIGKPRLADPMNELYK